MARRGAMFVTDEGPADVIVGQVSVNPEVFLEQVGTVTDLKVEDSGDDRLAGALLNRLERWMASKQATEIETLPIRRGDYQAWKDRGFEPYLIWFRERRVGSSQPAE